MTFDLWVISDASGKWELHVGAFQSKDAAEQWAKRYIPDAVTEVRLREGATR